MSEANETTQGQANKLDETTQKYAAKYDAFAKTTSGNFILEFVRFEKNIVPYTLQIAFVFGVLAAWACGIAGIFGAGPLGDGDFMGRLIGCVVLVVAGPFVIHYVLEVVKYVFVKIATPLWEKIFIRYLVNVLPEFLPFMLEWIMKAMNIALDGMVACIMTVAAVLKGVVWLPKLLCRRLADWCEKSAR